MSEDPYNQPWSKRRSDITRAADAFLNNEPIPPIAPDKSHETSISASVVIAPRIPPDHWLNDPKYAWFKNGYLAASISSDAIPTLAEIKDIEGLYRVVYEILYENDIIADGVGGLKSVAPVRIPNRPKP